MTDTLRERAEAIWHERRGTLLHYADGKSAAMKEIQIDEFWKALQAGGCWTDEPQPARAPILRATSVRRAATADELPLVAVLMETPDAPILSKVYQESDLRLAPGRVALHPDAARACGVEDGARAWLQTLAGKCEVRVTVDAGVAPGMLQVAARPAVRDVCSAGDRAKVVRA